MRTLPIVTHPQFHRFSAIVPIARPDLSAEFALSSARDRRPIKVPGRAEDGSQPAERECQTIEPNVNCELHAGDFVLLKSHASTRRRGGSD